MSWCGLSDDVESWRQRCARFAQEEMAPRFRDYDRSNAFPAAIHRQAYAWGLMNKGFAPELGGEGLPWTAISCGGEALAAVCAPCAFSLGFNHGALAPVVFAGTPEQRQVFIRDRMAERRYTSVCLTEGEVSGSNLLGIQTRADRTGKGWVIRGDKCMVGMGTEADLYLVLARAFDGGRDLGLTFFAVPRTPAVQVGENTDKLGFRAVPTPRVTFAGAEVDDWHRIGEAGDGMRVLLDTLGTIRVGGAGVILGLVVGALRDVLPWLQDRGAFGGDRLLDKSHVQLKLGRTYAELQAARRQARAAAEHKDAGLPCGEAASIAKLMASELAVRTTTELSQWFGWRGIDNDYPIQKRVRDARQTTIFEGTSDVQALSLFRTLWGQYREGLL